MAHISIIEDDPSFAEALSRIVSAEHEVTLYDAVPENIGAFSTGLTDLLFLDCMLPGESGPEFLSRLRSHEASRKLPVILMSAHHEMMNEANALTGEFEEFLKKPCTMRQVIAVLQRYLPAVR